MWGRNQGRLLGGGGLRAQCGNWRWTEAPGQGWAGWCSLHTPRPLATSTSPTPPTLSAHRQERKRCWAGWGSGEGGRAYHSAHQLSHPAHESSLETHPTSLAFEPTVREAGLGSGAWLPALTSVLLSDPVWASLGLSEPTCEMGGGWEPGWAEAEPRIGVLATSTSGDCVAGLVGVWVGPAPAASGEFCLEHGDCEVSLP